MVLTTPWKKTRSIKNYRIGEFWVGLRPQIPSKNLRENNSNTNLTNITNVNRSRIRGNRSRLSQGRC